MRLVSVGFLFWFLLLGTFSLSCHASQAPPAPSTQLVKGQEKAKDSIKLSSSVKKPSTFLQQENRFNALKPYLTTVGGIVGHMTLGTLYCWGNFVSYTPQKLKYFKASGQGSPDALIILPLHMVAQALTMPIGPMIQKRVGAKLTMLLATTLLSSGVLLSSFTQNLALFSFLYAVLFGFGVGIGYSAPMIAAWQWFPKLKGLIAGLILAGFGSGAFFFNKIGSFLVNPDGLNAVDGVFPEEVYARFPSMLRKLSLIYLLVGIFAASLVSQPKAAREAEIQSLQLSNKQEESGPTAIQTLNTRPFQTFWTMIMLSAQSGLNTVGVYKVYGSLFENLQSDSFHSLVGGLGSLCNGVGRVMWGMVLDKIGYKTAYAVCITMQIVCMAIFPLASASKFTYALAVCLMFLCMGGNFAMAPTTCIEIWGNRLGPNVFGYLFSAFSTASLLSYFLTKRMVATVGWNNLYRAMSLFSAIAFGLLMTFSQKSPIKNKQIPMKYDKLKGEFPQKMSS
mmetsp:Transcript_10172/g.13341  ORF Transcript_10172/g.13341 Transcript_10172/m.13341 type:complete len:507 (+) Transcript_10172:169-1689(+)